MIDDYHTKALLIAMGGNSALAVASINHFSPELLCFVLAEQEKETIESQVQPQISRMPQRWDWILTPDADSFAQSHLAITKSLPDILKTWGVQPGELVLDLSAATPAMAAAVALVSGPFTSKVVQLRKSDGTIPENKTVMVGGESRVYEDSNPWNEGAASPRREASLLFNQGAFSSAAKKFRHIEGMVSGSLKPLYHSLGDLAEGYSLWEAFHYREAWEKLKASLKALELASVWGGPAGLSAVLGTAKSNAAFLEGIVLDPHDVKFSVALDLLAHAKRRAERDHQIEVATLTLLRGLEACAQHQLMKQFHVKSWDVQADQLPQDLQEPCRQTMLDDVDGKYKLPLPAQFRALAGFGDPMGQTFVTEWPKMKTLLDSAYQSVLGHGFQNTKTERFHQLYALVLKLTKVEESSLPRFPSMTL